MGLHGLIFGISQLSQLSFFLIFLMRSIVVRFPTSNSTDHLSYRCTAMPDNLDRQAGRRSHELTRRLMEIINSKLLWDEYGIDDDITVRLSLPIFN